MMQRELVRNAFARKSTSISPFWVGHPADETKQIYYEQLDITETGLSDLEKHNRKASVLKSSQADEKEIMFNKKINSDLIWMSPDLDLASWKHPGKKPMWDCFLKTRESLGEVGIFSECDDIAEVEKFEWPNPDYLDFSATLQRCQFAYEQGFAIIGGMWCPFFHIVSDFFGMENYFMKMYTDKEIVHSVTSHVVDFLVETNRRFFAHAAQYLEAGFFGNDFGTQRDLMISPELFDEFLLPYLKRIIATITDAGLKTAFHCCGAVDRIIPRLIDSGVEILHPLQALAAGMDAQSLEKKYGRDLVFMGGVDTQQLLTFGSPNDVREEVLRLRDIFTDHYIVSPSHEALLPNIPLENVIAMSKAAKE